MKKFYICSILLIIVLLLIQYKDNITEYVLLNYVYKNDFNYTNSNTYKNNNDYSYFKTTTNFKPENQKDILNIIYSSINNGYDKFNFYCKYSYERCINDVKTITADYELLSNVNNFVHPFNSYNKLDLTINSLGKIEFSVEKLYNDEMIKILNNKLDEIYNKLINDNMSDYEKIKAIHDYIINNTKYDKVKVDDLMNNKNNSQYLSHTAYGPLVQGYGICSGYADAMAIFLNKMNIPNYKISSDDHIWNLVYIDNKWLHLDLTWDDPLINTGEEVIEHEYFLITTEQLFINDSKKDNTRQYSHNFDKNIFIEANNL